MRHAVEHDPVGELQLGDEPHAEDDARLGGLPGLAEERLGGVLDQVRAGSRDRVPSL